MPVAQPKSTPKAVGNLMLREVRRKEYRPLDLMESLSKAGYSSAELKLALAQLLHEGRVELASKRVLRPAGAG